GVEQRTPRTGVGDRERATGQLVGRGLVITGAGCKVGDLPRQTGDVEVARVLEYRHDESAFGVDGDPDVLRAVVDDLLAFDGGVEFRVGLERFGRREGEEGQVGEIDTFPRAEFVL